MLLTALNQDSNPHAASAGAMAKNAPLAPWKWLSKRVIPCCVGIKATVLSLIYIDASCFADITSMIKVTWQGC